jgi:enterobactin synthetase component D
MRKITVMSGDIAFRIDLPHGRCVGVRIPEVVGEANLALIPSEERSYLETLSVARKPTWFAGRVALRAALADLGIEVGPILSTKRGAPELPDDICGSISHKRAFAVGLAARNTGGFSIGVDLEPVPVIPPKPTEPGWDNRPDISSRVMTADELGRLATVPERQRRREVVLCFSIKEALYKAINPVIGRYVSFQEATVNSHGDGQVDVKLALLNQEGDFHAEARWSEIEGHFLTTARIHTDR